jgi:hypothetical protein
LQWPTPQLQPLQQTPPKNNLATLGLRKTNNSRRAGCSFQQTPSDQTTSQKNSSGQTWSTTSTCSRADLPERLRVCNPGKYTCIFHLDLIEADFCFLQRWKTLQREVLKFCAIHNWIKGKPSSGSTPKDWLITARQLYFDETNKSFAYKQPWTLLRNAAKFKPPDQTQAINGRRPSATPSNNPIPDSLSVPGGASSNTPNQWQHPLGTCSTKRKLNKEEYKNKKMKLLQTSVKEASKRLKEAKRANDIQDKLVAINREKMGINLMFINANNCPDNLSCK